MGSIADSKVVAECSDDVQIGDRIGMSFNQGDLEHELYGRAENVSGVIPLLLPHGSYKNPSILEDKNKLNSLVRQMTHEYRSLWEDELDDAVASKVKDFLLFGAHTNPLDDVASDKMQTYISAIILIFAIDDLCDQLSDGSNKTLKFNDIKKMTQFLMDIFNGVYASYEDMPNPIKAIEYANAYIWKTKTMCEQHVPDWFAKNKYCKQEWVNVLSTYVLFTEKGTGYAFSNESRILFGSYQAAVSGYMESVALIRNLTISDEIRSDILFQRMRVAAGSVSNLMNDVFGLARDMELGQVKDTSILREVMDQGIPLAEAVKNTVKNLCDEINDVKMCIERLRECFGEEEDLMEYLCCLERMLDGQLYWYEHTERYRNANLKIVKMKNST